MTYNGIPLGLYKMSYDIKRGDTVRFIYRKKIRSGKVHKIGMYGIDVYANGKYFYCREYDAINSIYKNASETKAYNERD